MPTTNSMPSLPIRPTRHARERIAQRGIDPAALSLLLIHGDDLPAARGARLRALKCKTVAELIADGHDRAEVETARQLEAVVGPTEEVITVWKRARPMRSGRQQRTRR